MTLVSEARAHAQHGWTVESTDHIQNVPYLASHKLMRCPCGFYGWFPTALTYNTRGTE